MLPVPNNGPKSGKDGTRGAPGVSLSAPSNVDLLQMSAPVAVGGGNARGKVPLKPGRSLLDWMRLGRSGKDLAGTNGRLLKVSTEELALHNKEDDAWMVLNGRVYNVTPYMEFHPGGIPELMRGAGIDGTLLFNEVHRWVNYESMLEKCLVGKYVPSIVNTAPVKRNSMDSLKIKSTNDDVVQPPSYDWSQTDTTATLSIGMENMALDKENVIIDQSNKSFHLRLLTDDHVFHIEYELADEIDGFSVRGVAGKVEVVLAKKFHGKMWPSFGKDGAQNDLWKKRTDEDVVFGQSTVTSVSSVTHDTKLFCLEFPQGTHMIVPVGCHVFVRDRVLDEPVVREYTVVPPSVAPAETAEQLAVGRFFCLMIKIYPDGLLTPSLGRLKPGDKLDVSTAYAGNFRSSRLKNVRHLTMYAAGTGFTPMASLLHYSLIESVGASRSLQLVFFNKQKRDILWKDELDQLSSSSSGLSVHYVLSDPQDGWEGLTGRVSKELMESLSPKPADGDNVLLCACGPTQFTQKVIKFAGELGYDDKEIFAFTS